MKDEYIIISKTAIQKRIEELEKKSKEIYYREGIDEYDFAKLELEEFLSQSTPLIPEIEKAYTAGMEFIGEDKGSPNEYISNLKLDI